MCLLSLPHALCMETKADTGYVQFSGVILSADSLNPVPFTTIVIVDGESRKGTIADYNGFFTFVAQRCDTVEFTAVGYINSTYVIPDSITGDRYSLIQLMQTDTVLLTETVIYPWPSKEDFKEAFINLDIPDDEYTIGRKNLEKANLRTAMHVMPADGSENFKYNIQERTNKLYYAGGIQPNQLLNPFAWAKFIRAWKEGKFKADKKQKEEIKRLRKLEKDSWDYDEWIEK